MDDLRPLLLPVSRAITANTKALAALERVLISEAGAQKERDERAEALAAEVRETLAELPAAVEAAVAEGVAAGLAQREPTAIERAKERRAVEIIETQTGLLAGAKGLPRAFARWFRQDPARAGLFLTTVTGATLELLSGGPMVRTVLGAVARFAVTYTSAGGATP